MLYFCSVNDIKSVMQSAPRFDDDYDRVRKAVTEDMNTYMRRTLDFESGLTEVFDTSNVETGDSFSVWLGKKNVDPNSVVVNYNAQRIFDGDNVIASDNVMVDRAKGKVTIYSFTRPGRGTLRIQYAGGYPVRSGTSDVMEAPDSLYSAALGECVFRLSKLLNLNVGNSEDSEGRNRSPQRKLIGNLLYDTAMALTAYRKPLGTI